MPPSSEDDKSTLESARERLYGSEGNVTHDPRATLAVAGERTLPHVWEEGPHPGKRHVRFAGIFLAGAAAFFLVSLGVTIYFFYYGGNSVSIDRISINIQGPTTIAGGDTVPLALTITNKNPAAISNATIEIDFPKGTRSAANLLQSYPRYVENLGTIASGATVTRSVKAVIFGGAGETLTLPVLFSYGTFDSNATFVKKSSYPIAISSTPLSISIDSLAETVSGAPLMFTLTVRSNATIPLDNVVLAGTFPFGFSVASSSLPMSNSTFLLGTLMPGARKVVTLTGALSGQDNEQTSFHFTVGTADAAGSQTLAVTYMTQNATVNIVAPFIDTTLALNGNASSQVVLTSGSSQSVAVSYSNTLATNVTNATVAIAISGSAVDYGSIQTTSGFYDSATHTVVFDSGTDPALASLAPGASGVGAFTFSTLPATALPPEPTVVFTTSVSGTRVGQTNVPEAVNSSAVETAKVATTVILSASALHTSGPFSSSGPVPPRANQATTYTIVWNAQNEGNPVAGGTVSATLPSYVSYTGNTTGTGFFSYDQASRIVTWNTSDIAQGASAQGAFQVSFTPSTTQVGTIPALMATPASFSGYDRFAGEQIQATANPVTTETTGDPGYVSADAIVAQ